jgi:YgiT-type zinc finger domain-containing protein
MAGRWLATRLIRKIPTGIRKEARMDSEAWKNRRCPECGSKEYQFRSRKKMVDEAGKKVVETKYRCKECEKEWWEKVGG